MSEAQVQELGARQEFPPLLAVDGVPVSGHGAGEVTRRLQGQQGSTVVLTLRRGELERTHRLRRQRLL